MHDPFQLAALRPYAPEPRPHARPGTAATAGTAQAVRGVIWGWV